MEVELPGYMSLGKKYSWQLSLHGITLVANYPAILMLLNNYFIYISATGLIRLEGALIPKCCKGILTNFTSEECLNISMGKVMFLGSPSWIASIAYIFCGEKYCLACLTFACIYLGYVFVCYKQEFEYEVLVTLVAGFSIKYFNCLWEFYKVEGFLDYF